MNRTLVRIGWIVLAAMAAVTGLALLLSLGNPAQASLSAATARYVASDGLDSGNCQTVAGRSRRRERWDRQPGRARQRTHHPIHHRA